MLLTRFPHQEEVFQKSKNMPAFALEMEVRCGKTLPTIDTFIHQYEQGVIDAVWIVAPNGVDLAWARINLFEYIESMTAGTLKDLNKDSLKVLKEAIVYEWSNSTSKIELEKQEEFLSHKGLKIFCSNNEGIADRLNKYGAIVSSKQQVFVEKFLDLFKVFIVDDEAHCFKDPGSKRTKAMIRLSKKKKAIRNLTGTPVTKSPFDTYSQYHIMDPLIIKNYLGQPMKWSAFKQRFGYWKKQYLATHSFQALDTEQGDGGYKDLDHLYSMIDPYRYRVTQKELKAKYPDLFPFFTEPVIEKRMYEMPKHHQRVYDELRDELITLLDSGQTLTADQRLVNMVRLQQISRGYAGGVNEDKTVQDLGGPYPAIKALLDVIEQVEGKVIVWCLYTADVELILKSLADVKIKAVRYDGQVSKEDREIAKKQMWEDKDSRVIVGTAAAGGVGVDLAFANCTIFYSFGYRLEHWEQAVGRFQGPKQKSDILLLVEIVCAGTNDLICLDNLANKRNLSDIITGDSKRFKDFLMGKRLNRIS